MTLYLSYFLNRIHDSMGELWGRAHKHGSVPTDCSLHGLHKPKPEEDYDN